MSAQYQAYIAPAIEAALLAGNAILEVYNSGDFNIENKSDASPLTKADKASHHAIVQVLDKTGLPLLSEEGKTIPFDVRKDWGLFWLIDPLDGTKEFIKRNGEFTVNIALIDNGVPVMGVVYVPVTQDLYYGCEGLGAFKKQGTEVEHAIHAVSPGVGETVTIVASRSHMSPETEAFIAEYPGATLTSMGSSLKLLLVAEGKAHLYPRYAPTMEWDTAAAHAVVNAAGGEVLAIPAQTPLVYNKQDLLNPWFLVQNK